VILRVLCSELGSDSGVICSQRDSYSGGVMFGTG
jgi:hypothetical protein